MLTIQKRREGIFYFGPFGYEGPVGGGNAFAYQTAGPVFESRIRRGSLSPSMGSIK